MKQQALIFFILIFSRQIMATEPDSAFNTMLRQEIGGWIAADATYSILLPDGRTLWLFGDTFIGEVNPDNSIKSGSKFIRNSAVIQDDDQLNTLFTGTRADPSAFILTAHPDSTWYWPEHGAVEGDSLYIFVSKFHHKDNGSEGFNFEQIGLDLAVSTYPGLEVKRTIPVAAYSLNDVIYGDRVLVDTGYTYIYGRKSDPEYNIPYPHVARAIHGEMHLQEWEYFDGMGWSGDASATKRMNSFQVSQQYSVSTYRGKYILLTQDIWLSPDIYSFTSETPVGPWSNRRRLFTTPETGGSTFTYNAYVHPQFDRNGEMLMSYNVNGDFWSIFNNVELYRPRFIRIPYMNLDYAFWPNSTEEHGVLNHKDMCIYPNPVVQVATLLVTATRSKTVEIRLTDMQGREVIAPVNVDLTSGENRITFETDFLAGGVYFCRVIIDSESYTLPLLKN
jgi:hypothetical protein